MDKNLIAPDKPVFPISVVADQLKVHQRTLRIYDDEKILSPTRSPKNRRLYSFNDMKKGGFIQYLTQNTGLNLAGVKITLGFLEMLEVSPDDYTKTIEKLASKYKI
jgi:DNA-binding transcriptional MerR regulator